MTILLDFSNISYAALLTQRDHKDADYCKFLIIRSLLAVYKRFKNEYGEMVICCDAKNIWRKDIFPYYKGKRKDNRETSSTDWDQIFKILTELKQELRDNFKWKIIEVDKAEADDIIGILSRNVHDKVMIVGSDKDFKQCHSEFVKQFSNNQKKFIECDDPVIALRELIITGDPGDGIPNIKSDGDTLMTECKRQPPISKVKLAEWSKYDDPKYFCETLDMLENYKRNKQLIDFSCIPDNIKSSIVDSYKELEVAGDAMKIKKYFMDNNMPSMIKELQNF